MLGCLLLAGSASVGCQEESSETSGSQAEEASEEATNARGDEEKPLDNRLKWSTASEVDNFGYYVYRGETEEGPFERVTEDPLPGAGTTDEPSYYEFVDDRIDPTRDYYYYVESVAMDGTKERFTPVIRAKAKHPHPQSAEGKKSPDETVGTDTETETETEDPAETELAEESPSED